MGLFVFLLASCSEKNGGNVLFQENGTDWSKKGEASWTFDGNELTGSPIAGGTGFVMTHESYSDFELQLEFMPDDKVNSGVFVRCRDYEISNTDCYEFNIWDRNPNQTYRTGGIVTRASPMAQVETNNKWSTYRIKCEKNHIRAWVDGILTADIENDELVEGYIGLQAADSGQVKFRNVKLMALGSE